MPAVSKHLKSIYEDRELDRSATVSKMEKVSREQGRSVSGLIEHCNLDAILAVGFRIRGPRGAQFRRWATEVLTEYLIKGFALNDEKLKDPTGKDYFSELLERIRDIRSSEARFYQQILDLVRTSADYSSKTAAESARLKPRARPTSGTHYSIGPASPTSKASSFTTRSKN